MPITDELKAYLEEKNLAVKSPTRGMLRDYIRKERVLVKHINAQDQDEAAKEAAQEELFDLRDQFVGNAYPGVDVSAIPADIFADMFTATLEKAQGNQVKN